MVKTRVIVGFLTIFLFSVLAIFTPTIPQVSAVGTWNEPNDFPMNFDQFQVGTVNPFPFKASGSLAVGTGVAFFGIFGCNQWCTAPNIYSLGANGATTVHLIATFNASAPKVSATIQSNCLNGGAYPAGDHATFSLNDSVMTNSTTQSGTTSKCQANNVSILYNVTVSAMPGKPVEANFSWTTTGTAYINLDNFNITYGSVIIPGYNFVLLNASSAGPYWFDPSPFHGSELKVNYSTGAINDSAQWTNPAPPQSGLVIPDVNYTNYASIKLFTMYVGNFYSRTLIPTPVKTQMLIDPPSAVFSYQVNVLSPNLFGQGSQIYISQGNRNITSGYLDSLASFDTFLVPGLYNIKIISSTGRVFQAIQNFPALSSTVNINAFSVSITNTAGIPTSIMWTAGWNSSTCGTDPHCTGINFAYQDATNSTSQLFLQIKSLNASGTFLVFQSVYSVPGCHGVQCVQSFTTVITANTPGFNKTTELIAYLKATNFLGTNASLGSYQISCQGCVGGLNLPILPFGLTILGNLSALSMIAYSIIILSAAGFGNYFGPFGFLVVAAEVAFFAFLGWLPTSLTSIAIVFIALAVTGLMWRHERTP